MVAATAPRFVLAPSGYNEWQLLTLTDRDQNNSIKLLAEPLRRWRFPPAGLPAQDVQLPADFAERARAFESLMCAAALLGLAQRALNLAVAHTRSRRQFGQPLADFQSVAHRLADMFCQVQLARAAVIMAAATATGDHGAPEPADAAGARLVAGTPLVDVITGAIHLHGARGLTTEVPLHLMLRRALVLRTLGGGSTAAIDRMRPRLALAASRSTPGRNT